jgi:RNA polymerase sigma-70 factor (ECF subfamily)
MEVIGPAPDDDDGSIVHLFTVESFDMFFRREYARLVTLAYALSGSRELAEDAAQDSMVTAFRRWDEIARMENPAAYIRKTCANTATSSLRRRLAEGRALLRLAGRRSGFAAIPDDSERFWSEVRRLPAKQAQAVALHYGCDLSVEETAAVLGMATGTVKDSASTSEPAKPKPTATAAPQPAGLPGSKMDVPLAVTAPSGWTPVIDDKSLRFWPEGSRPDTAQNIWLVEPTQVFDPQSLAPVPAPVDYATWIRSHPWLRVIGEKDVTVAGRPGEQLDVRVVDLPSQDIVPDSAHKIFLNYAHDATAPVAIYGMSDRIRLTVVDLGTRDLVIEGQGIVGSAEFSTAYSDFVSGVRLAG